MLRVLSRQAFSMVRAANFSASASSAGGGGLSDEVRKRIDGIVKKDDVVVFMKGTQQEPACGFSRNVKLVRENGDFVEKSGKFNKKKLQNRQFFKFDYSPTNQRLRAPPIPSDWFKSGPSESLIG